MPKEFRNVTVPANANVYFGGKVVSHTLQFGDGTKKTLGLIYPGEFRFNTGLPEDMEITAGSCRVLLKDQKEWKTYQEGEIFRIPGDSYFDIAVETGIAEYICSFG